MRLSSESLDPDEASTVVVNLSCFVYMHGYGHGHGHGHGPEDGYGHVHEDGHGHGPELNPVRRICLERLIASWTLHLRNTRND